MRPGSSMLRAGLFSVMLLILLASGLVFIPAWNERSGIIAAQGTSINVNPDSFAFIPFSTSQDSRISGSLSLSNGIQAYVVNSTQFRDLNPYSFPSTYEFASGYVSSLTLDLHVTNGSYYLVFYNVLPSNPSSILTVRVVQAIAVTPDFDT
jgi:hypothetical protein